MQITKTFINRNNTASITCPGCRKSRNIDVEKYRFKRHTIRVRCSCQHRFAVLLDFRKHFRKETNLTGTYKMLAPANGHGILKILNISKNGIGFTIGLDGKGSLYLVPGKKLDITFQLDNKKRSKLRKTVTIRSVRDQYIGAEFENQDAYDKELGFYLRS